jgi:hypothetical protein
MKRSVLLCSVLVVTAAAAAPAPPEGSAKADVPPNVKVTLFVGKSGGPSGSDEKTYKMLGQAGGPTRILMGWRAPIPTRQSSAEGSDAPATSFVYQNIGVSADLQTDVLPDRRLVVHGQVEISGARGAPLGDVTSSKPTLIGTFQQALRVVVAPGKRVRVAEAPDPDGGTLHLDIQVDLVE